MRVAVLTTLCLLLGGGPLRAQLVRGTISTAAGQPLGGALVAIADSAGMVVARTVTAPTGRYAVFVPGPGEWVLEVAAIGFTPRRERGIVVGDATVVRDLVLTERPFELPDLVSRQAGVACRADPASASTVLRLLDEATTALGLVEATIDSRRLEFVVESRQLRLGTAPGDTLRQTTTSRARASWPLTSAEPTLLERVGFVHDPGGLAPAVGYDDASGPIYYGPDLAVLAAPWFVASHCFELSPATTGDSLVVRFTPQRVEGRVELAGELVFDRASLALRHLRFRYVGLPAWVPPLGAGGEVTFERLPDGLWMTRRWELRAPIENRRGTLGARRGSSFGGWAEIGGRVVEVVGGG